MTDKKQSVRLKVSPEVARLVQNGAPRSEQLQAARGVLNLGVRDEADLLFFLAHGRDGEIREAAIATLRALPVSRLIAMLKAPERHPRFLDQVARLRLDEEDAMAVLLDCDNLLPATLLHMARHGSPRLLSLLAHRQDLLAAAPEVLEALQANPRATAVLEGGPEIHGEDVSPESSSEGEAVAEENAEADGALSKYQKALEMGVSAKIKMALTGDKEWRGIFIKDANKLVSAAVLKNPRITDGEVLAIAKNKSSSDELIRIITLNREWVKLYEIKKALVEHPRTPLPTALRYMNVLTEKDIKNLAGSRGVSAVIVNNARRMLIAKAQKK
ncbi:hypothetical protein [Desulfuromonas sp. AOP6]|uniref:hypothetical protein n=1 Tax=Desulfuromonas sp. AOP6 TaxID=1566351 RepID=UPI001282C29B|nr:hypothetical protein [Desulfuromonas sp. AOP6]BCA79242.1 hypothetical protein AOP6_1029 [Desulfuromonas sp. AOP6]